MRDLSRRAVFLNVAAVAAWPRDAAAEQAGPASTPALRRLVLEVSDLTEGFYRAAVTRTPFADAVVARYARELAADHGARFRRLGASGRPGGQNGGGDWRSGLDSVVGASGWSGAFDPFGGDAQFLLAAHVLESAASDALRLGAAHGSDLAAVAGEATYHAGLVRTALAATPAGRAAAPHAQQVTEVFFSLRSAPGVSGGPERKALRTLFLTSRPRRRGGFFPHGLQGSVQLSA